MVATTELDLAEFDKAVLRSERVRTLCMIVVFGMFVLLGAFRILVPVEGKVFIGASICGYALVYFVLEILMLRRVVGAIEADRPLSRALLRTQLILECLFPLGIMHALMLLVPDFRYTLLVSPGYAFMMLLIGVSVLRVDRLATLLTGLVCFLGYTGLAVWVLASPATTGPNPHPSAMYFNLALMLTLATGAAVFVAAQVRTYVAAAVREMQTRREHDRLKRDLEIAGEIQQGLLPPTMPRLEHYEFAAVCRQADQAGGDYFDWQEISSKRVAFSLGDVTGHGVGHGCLPRLRQGNHRRAILIGFPTRPGQPIASPRHSRGEVRHAGANRLGRGEPQVLFAFGGPRADSRRARTAGRR